MKINFENNPSASNSIIKVIGVGGGGSNAVNYMFKQGIRGVDFLICNTDAQSLESSGVPTKIQLGITLTEGRGAGSSPEVGKNAAIESIEELRNILKNNTKMVFVTAGMGGGTGTGAAPIIAATARELGILTVGIVTIPFTFEGKKRKAHAEDGLAQLRKNVDTLLVISNDKLREIFGNCGITVAFAQADNILTTAAKGIAEIITSPGLINTDFADVHTVMKDGGIALMGSASAEGDDRAMKALKEALTSPLLNDSSIKGAKQILVNIAFGEDISMDELGELMDYVQEEAGWDANVILGTSVDESLGGKVSITLVATGIQPSEVELPREFISISGGSHPEPRVTQEYLRYNLKDEFSEANDTSNVLDQNSSVDEEAIKFIPGAETRPELRMELKIEEISTNSEVKSFSDEEDMIRRSSERMQNVKNLSSRVNPPVPTSEMEEIPAFERRNIQLQPAPPSSSTNISRYTLSETSDEKKIEIKANNSFLHDNVD